MAAAVGEEMAGMLRGFHISGETGAVSKAHSQLNGAVARSREHPMNVHSNKKIWASFLALNNTG